MGYSFPSVSSAQFSIFRYCDHLSDCIGLHTVAARRQPLDTSSVEQLLFTSVGGPLLSSGLQKSYLWVQGVCSMLLGQNFRIFVVFTVVRNLGQSELNFHLFIPTFSLYFPPIKAGSCLLSFLIFSNLDFKILFSTQAFFLEA